MIGKPIVGLKYVHGLFQRPNSVGSGPALSQVIRAEPIVGANAGHANRLLAVPPSRRATRVSASEPPQSEPAGSESALLVVVGVFCVTTVSIVCTIKAPVPVRAEDGLDPPYLDGGWHGCRC